MKPFLLFVAVVAADLTTKAVLPTEDQAWHGRSTGWQVSTLLGLAFTAGLWSFSQTRLAAAFLAAGVAGNLVSSFFGAIANPFVYDNYYAFNLADVSLVAGAAALVGAFPVIVYDMRKRASA